MANTLAGSNDTEKLQNLCGKTHKEQAVWFLNAFWDTVGQRDAEKVWTWKHKFDELDDNNKAAGSSLDEFHAHRFLEFFKETLTVHAMRDRLRAVGAIGQAERPKLVPITHYLVWKYSDQGADWHYLVNAPQGSKEEIDKAQRMLDEVNAAFRDCQAKDAAASKALSQAKASEADAKAREADAKQREAEAKAQEAEAKKREAAARQAEQVAAENEAKSYEAQAVSVKKEEELRVAKSELEAALAEVKAQESAYNNRTNELKRLSEEGPSLVAKNRAKNELAQHLGEDPLPLRRAKITLEAAVKKADRATQAAANASQQAEVAAQQASAAKEEASAAANQASNARAGAEKAARQSEQARSAAEQARAEAEADRHASEQAKRAAEEALEEAQRKVEEAEAYLEEAKKSLPLGSTWWLERELHEAKAYLPSAKGGYAKKKF